MGAPSADITSNCISKYLNITDYMALLNTDNEYNSLDKNECWKNVLNSRYPEYFKIMYKTNCTANIIKELIYSIELYEKIKNEKIKEKKEEHNNRLFSIVINYDKEFEVSISEIFSISCQLLSNHLSSFMLEIFTENELFMEKSDKSKESIQSYKSLNTSCIHNNIDMVKIILEIGKGKLWEKNKKQLNCSFYYSCLHGRYEIFKLLLEDLLKYKKLFDTEYINFLFPTHNVKGLFSRYYRPPEYMHITELYIIACKGGNLDIVEWFYNIIGKDRFDFNVGMNSLKKAIKNGHLDLTKYIINKIKILCNDEKNKTDNIQRIKYMANESFLNACRSGKIKIFTYLIDNFDIDIADNDNFAIKNACNYGHLDVVNFLLDEKFNDKINLNNCLSCAFRNGHIEVGKILLKDPRVNCVENDNNAVYESIGNNRTNSLKILLDVPEIFEYMNNPDNKNDSIDLLNHACDFDKPNTIKLLLNNENIKYENVDLKYITVKEYVHENIEDILIILDPRINTSDDYINHKLIQLSYETYSNIDYKKIINELLEYLDPDFKFDKMDKIFEHLCTNGEFKSIDMLLNKFKYNPPNKKKYLKLCIESSIKKDNLEIFKMFTIKYKPTNGDLLEACEWEAINIINYLIELPDIDVNYSNNQILNNCIYNKKFESCGILLRSNKFKKASEVDKNIKDDDWDCNAKERLEYIAGKFRKFELEYYAKLAESYIDY